MLNIQFRLSVVAMTATVLVIMVGAAAEVPAAEGTAARRPNVVVLLADDLGYGELGCQGNAQIPTPHIDALAEQGVRCTSGYVTAAYCSASRAGLITGRYPSRFGYEFNPIGPQNDDPHVGLPKTERTLAQRLRDAGYATALIGKWHLGATTAFHPLQRGFDEFFGFLHEGHYYVPAPYRSVTSMLRRKALPDGGQGSRMGEGLVLSTHMGHNEPAYDAGNPILRGGQPVEEAEYLTRALTREACDFIGRHRDRPFFLYLAYNAVHSPMQAEREIVSQLSSIQDIHRRVFAGMLVSLDQSVGQVLQALSDAGVENDTLVFFLSDNGGPTRELTSSNLPLRGGKGDMYEGGIRIPYVVRWPGVIPVGKTFDMPVSSLDIVPTALQAAGVAPPGSPSLDGVDLLPHLRGRVVARPHRELFWRAGNRAALRRDDWKLVRNDRRAKDATSWQLFDLAEDLSEVHDLARSRPEQLAQLIAAWRRLEQRMPPPQTLPR